MLCRANELLRRVNTGTSSPLESKCKVISRVPKNIVKCEVILGVPKNNVRSIMQKRLAQSFIMLSYLFIRVHKNIGLSRNTLYYSNVTYVMYT